MSTAALRGWGIVLLFAGILAWPAAPAHYFKPHSPLTDSRYVIPNPNFGQPGGYTKNIVCFGEGHRPDGYQPPFPCIEDSVIHPRDPVGLAWAVTIGGVLAVMLGAVWAVKGFTRKL